MEKFERKLTQIFHRIVMTTQEVFMDSYISQSISNAYSSPPLYRPYVKPHDFVQKNLYSLIPGNLWEAATGEKVKIDQIITQNAISVLSANQEDPRRYVNMAKDRQNCRKLQDDLQFGTDKFRNIVLNSLIPYLGELYCDPSANFVVQKLLDYATREQKISFLNAFKKDPFEIANHPCGSRVMQKFIECADTDLVDELYVFLSSSILDLCQSLHGNRIVQQFIDILPNRVPEIIKCIMPYTISLVADNCGCRVVQHLFQPFDQNKLAPLISEVIKAAPQLTANQYGNYVIQNIIDDGNEEQVAELIKSYKGYYYSFSIHKFASNVIERCIRRANQALREFIFADIIGVEENYNYDRIYSLITDKFGNYVIQRILEFGSDSQINAIYDVVDKNYDELQDVGYAKHVITKLKALGFE